MASAFKASAVWFYQELARRIGKDRMQLSLDLADYGNRTMGGPIDRFWLDGGLRISPRQQVDFLVRLHRGSLPFSPRALAIVREIMIQEKTEPYTLRAKTGWSDATTPGVGWYVGYIERKDRTVFFATEIAMRNEGDAPARVQVTRAILRQLGLTDLIPLPALPCPSRTGPHNGEINPSTDKPCHVGFGTDYDGGFGLQSVPADIDSIADLQKLYQPLLEKGYSEKDIAAIFGNNWIERLRSVLPEES